MGEFVLLLIVALFGISSEAEALAEDVKTIVEQTGENSWQVSSLSQNDSPESQVTLYEHGSKSGNQLEVFLNYGECVELPSNFKNTISWVQTYDSCVELCDLTSCAGECLQIKPTLNRNGVGILNNFNDRAESLKLCEIVEHLSSSDQMQNDQPSASDLQASNYREAKVLQITDEQWQLSTGDRGIPKHHVTLYEHGFLEGNILEVYIESGECLDLPHLFNEQISSLDIHNHECVKLCDEIECTGSCETFKANENAISAQTFVGDINDKASSIMLCDNEGEGPIALAYGGPEEQLAQRYEFLSTSGRARLITLYEHGFMRGHKLEVYLNPEQDTCKNIPEFFDEQTSSIDTHGNCAALCDSADCKGRCKSFAPYPGILDTGYWLGDFNDKASSIRLCFIEKS